MRTLKRIENTVVRLAYKASDKRTPVRLGDLVRHNLTGLDGQVVGLQFTGWFKPKCFLTVRNNLTGRIITNINRDEFTHAVNLRLIDPRRMNINHGRTL